MTYYLNSQQKILSLCVHPGRSSHHTCPSCAASPVGAARPRPSRPRRRCRRRRRTAAGRVGGPDAAGPDRRVADGPPSSTPAPPSWSDAAGDEQVSVSECVSVCVSVCQCVSCVCDSVSESLMTENSALSTLLHKARR